MRNDRRVTSSAAMCPRPEKRLSECSPRFARRASRAPCIFIGWREIVRAHNVTIIDVNFQLSPRQLIPTHPYNPAQPDYPKPPLDWTAAAARLVHSNGADTDGGRIADQGLKQRSCNDRVSAHERDFTTRA